MLNQKIGLAVLLGAFAAGDTLAQSTLTNYLTGDVLLCFRKAGNEDLVVDAGPITTLKGYAVNSTNLISSYTPSQLSEIGNFNSVFWSAFSFGSDSTLYMTRARGFQHYNTPSTPWVDTSATVQNATIQRIQQIPIGAANNYKAGLNDPASTPGAIVEDDSSSGNPNYPTGLSYHDALFGQFGAPTWASNFQGSPENSTTNFNGGDLVERSDFYQLAPGTGTSTLLGYFQLTSSGVLTYVAYPSSPAGLSAITENSTSHTITYTTGTYGTYSLRATSNIAAPISTWPILQTLPNNVKNATTVDVTTDAVRFYTITAQ